MATTLIVPLGGCRINDLGSIQLPLEAVSATSGLTLRIQGHQKTQKFENAYSRLDFGNQQSMTPDVDIVVSGPKVSGEDAWNVRKNHVQVYWLCLQAVFPSAAFIKLWYFLDGSPWGTFTHSMTDNHWRAKSVPSAYLLGAVTLWDHYFAHQKAFESSDPNSPHHSHLLRATTWLYSAFKEPWDALRTLLLSIALETTLSPDLYSDRVKTRRGQKQRITDVFARRLGSAVRRLNLPPPPNNWPVGTACRLIYALRSVIVHGDPITAAQGFNPSKLEKEAKELTNWIDLIARATWAAAIQDKNYLSTLTGSPSQAPAYWEQ